jgi:hypothetical protein
MSTNLCELSALLEVALLPFTTFNSIGLRVLY